MSSVDAAAPAPPGLGTFANGAPRAADPTVALSDKERATLTKILANPLDYPAEFAGWLEDFVRVRLTASSIAGIGSYGGTTGELLLLAKDYTAQTGVYTLDLKGGTWMYMNGATFAAASYPDLNAYLGTNVLPDTRGRSLFLAGTHAAAALFANDGVAVASRQPKHTHSDSLGVSGSPGGTFVTSVTTNASTIMAGGTNGVITSLNTPTGSPTSGSLSVSGSVGSGMAGSDAIAHIILGSAFIHV